MVSGVDVAEVSRTQRIRCAGTIHPRCPREPPRFGFEDIRVKHIEIHGVEQPTADSLAAKFEASCPIYNTIRRGSGIELTVTAHS